jgi:hypothetical protein
MPLLVYSDFVGKFALHTGMYDQSKLTDYIVRYEQKYLTMLFGHTLYLEFISDISSVTNAPQSPNFQYVFNPFQFETGYNVTLISEGILDMLKGFIYFEYSKDLVNQMTPFGNVLQKSENSTVATPLYSMYYTRYNESVTTLRAIQRYITENFTQPTGQLVSMTNLLTGNNFYASNQLWTVAPIVFNKSVKRYTIFSTGIGYSTSTNVAVTGGSGSGMTVSFSILGGGGGVIDAASIQIVNRGSGYTALDLVSITGTTFTTVAVITINEVYPEGGGIGCLTTQQTWPAGAINASNITVAGTTYAVGDLVPTTVISGAVGSGAIIQVLTVSNVGAVLTYKFTDFGSGYAIGSTLQGVAGIGSGSLTIFVSSIHQGNIKTIDVTNKGYNFKVGTVIGIPNPNGVLPTQYNAANPSFNLYTVTYIGKGLWNTIRGRIMQFAYWL